MKQTECEILETTCRLLGKLGIMTADQIVRFFDPEDQPTAAAVADYLVELGLTGSMFWDVPAASETKVRAGAGKLQRVEFFYLRSKGKELVRKTGMKACHIHAGRPRTKHRMQRIYHELLVTEALLWWWRQGNVFDFFNERELKSFGKVPADLRVICIEGKRFITHDCEILVQNTRRQIENKSDHLLWFTPSLRQADIVDTVKRAPVVMINLQPSPSLATAQNVVNRILTPAETIIMDALKRCGGTLTAPAAAKILGKDRAQTSSILCALAADKRIFAAGVHASPGKSAGCPTRVFALNAADIILLDDRLFALWLSKKIVTELDAGWFPVAVDRRNSVASFSNDRETRLVRISQNASA